MDRLDAIRAFTAVADLGGFAPAARRLHLSPAAVTRAVALLEDHLGLMLLNRTTRSVRLTERGAIYLDTCRRVLADLEQGERQAQGQDSAPRGHLTVSAPILFGRLHVLPIVQDLLLAHPALSVRLMLVDRIVHLVEEDVDVAVRIGDLADSALVAVKVGEMTRVVTAAPAYLQRRGAPRVPADLARHDLIAFESIDGAPDWRFGPEGKTSVRVQPRLLVNGADAAIAACEAGLGITRALSYQVGGGIAAGRLVPLLEAFALPPVPISLVHPARRLGSGNLTAFMDAARRRFRERPVGAG
jgi:DNA-binding transcriptional LysR family regulator